MTRLRWAALPVLLLAAGCAPGGAASGSEDFRVVATTSIVGDLTAQLVGDDGSVEVLMRPGQDAHTFSASARQAQAIREADVVVAMGLGLEEALADTLASAEQDGVTVVHLGEAADPVPLAVDHGGEDDHGGDGLDPHVWFDPVRMADAARATAEAMATAAPETDQAAWRRRGDALAEEILDMHAQVEETLAAIPERCRLLVTNHDALGYLAQRYGFEVVGSVIPGTSTQADPSARDFAALADTLRETGVPAIFAETSQPTRLAEALAAEVDRDIVVVPLHTESLGEPGTEAATYTGMMLANARLIADALAPCSAAEGSAWSG